MIVAILAIILALISPSTGNVDQITVIPPKPTYAPTAHISEEEDWALYWADAYGEYLIDFLDLFDSLSYSRTNGREIMRRRGQSKFIYCRKVK
jgi:hypothetical protein